MCWISDSIICSQHVARGWWKLTAFFLIKAISANTHQLLQPFLHCGIWSILPFLCIECSCCCQHVQHQSSNSPPPQSGCVWSCKVIGILFCFLPGFEAIFEILYSRNSSTANRCVSIRLSPFELQLAHLLTYTPPFISKPYRTQRYF